MARGFFITFESIDGLGKTTQVERLGERLREVGHEVLITKEPGDAERGSNIGMGIRHLLFKDPTTHKLRPGVADMLFFADHLQTAGDVEEAIDEGKVVISDRYADSQFAYAAGQNRKAPGWTLDLYAQHYGLQPDLTILLVASGPLVEVPYPAPLRGTKLVRDISWALRRAQARRGAEAGKQEAKAWNTLDDQLSIQDEYLKRLVDEPRTFTVQVFEHSTIEDISGQIFNHTVYRMVRSGAAILEAEAA